MRGNLRLKKYKGIMLLYFDKNNPGEFSLLKGKKMICNKKCENIAKTWSLLIIFYRKHLNLQTGLYKIT